MPCQLRIGVQRDPLPGRDPPQERIKEGRIAIYACLVKTASMLFRRHEMLRISAVLRNFFVGIGRRRGVPLHLLVPIGAMAAALTPVVAMGRTHELPELVSTGSSAGVATQVDRASHLGQAAELHYVPYQSERIAIRGDAVGTEPNVLSATGLSRFRALLAFYRRLGLAIRAALAACLLLTFLFLVRLSHLRKCHRMARRAERERIARDIHDTLLQGAQALLFRLQMWEDNAQVPEFLRVEIASVTRQTESIVLQGRERIRTMRRKEASPSDLAEALGVIGHEAADAQMPAFNVEVVGETKALTVDAEEQLLDIAREAVRNACSHARATRIEVTLEYRRRSLRMMIADDGQGFDAAAQRDQTMHFGLVGMRERARQLGAQFRVRSSRNSGTGVEVIVPARGAFLAAFRWPWQGRAASSKDTASLQPTKS